MKKKILILMVGILSSSHLYSSNPLSLRMDMIKSVWLDEKTKIIDQPAVAEIPGTLTDYGSTRAPLSVMRFSLLDNQTNSLNIKTTSQMIVKIGKSSLLASNDGAIVDYSHESVDITVEQKIFSENHDVITRSIQTKGVLRISSGGIFTEPTGNIHFTLPSTESRSASTYDVALGGQVVPFSLPF